MFLRNNIIASLFTLALLFVSPYANAQTDFRDGYVLKTERDTLRGKIDYRGSIRMATICVFQSTTGETTTYKPEDIFGYRFENDKYFVSQKINDKPYFLEFLIEGKLRAYYLEDEKGSHYFISKENERMVELTYEEGIKYAENTKVTYETTKHIGLLKYYTKDAPQLAAKINSFGRPDHQSLIKLAKEYHNIVCTDQSCIVYEKKGAMLRVSLEALAGHVMLGKTAKEEALLEGKSGSFFQKGLSVYFWTSKKNEKIFVRCSILHLPIKDGVQAFLAPIQIGYMAPRTFKVRPTFAISLFSPTYTAGLMVKLHKNIHIGAQSWIRFSPSDGGMPFFPKTYAHTSIMGNLLIDLF